MAIQNLSNRVFRKYLITYLVISMIPLVVLSAAGAILSSRMLVNQSINKLKSILYERDDRITNYIQGLEKNGSMITADPRMASFMEGLLKKRPMMKPPGLEQDFEYLISGHGYRDMIVTDNSGNIVSSINSEPYFNGNIITSPDLKNTKFALALKTSLKDGLRATAGFGEYGPRKKYAMFMIFPVVKNKNILGAFSFMIQNSDIERLTENYNGTGKSGELLAGISRGSDILFISTQNRGDKGAFRTNVKKGGKTGVPMQLAADGRSGSGVRFDYSGVKVLAAWTFNKAAGWGLVAKEDYSEVMGPVRGMNIIFFIIAVIIILLTAFAASRAAAEAAWPLIVLADAAKNMAKGDLGARVILNTGDEFQLVADNFNEMASAIQANDQKLKLINDRLTAETRRAGNYLDISEAIIIELDTKGNIITFNRKTEELLGYPLKEISGKNWFDIFINPEIRNGLQENYEKLMKGKSDNIEYFERSLKAKNGGIKTFYMHITLEKEPDGAVIKAVSSGIDITNLRKTEKELVKSEELFRLMFEKSIAGKALNSAGGVMLKVNDSFAGMLGYTREELVAKSFTEITFPDDIPANRDTIRALTAGEINGFRGKKRYLHKNGSVVWCDVSTTMLRDENGAPLNLVTTVIDITGTENAWELLAESEEKFRLTFEQTRVGIVLVSADHRMMKVNRKFCEMTGYTEAELENMKFTDVTYKEDVENNIAGVKKLQEGKIEVYSDEKRYVKKDGSIVWADINISAVRKNGIYQYSVSIIEDISARKLAEEALINSERKLRSFYESGIVGVIYWNADGLITDANDEFLNMTRFTRAELEAGRINWRVITPHEYAGVDVEAMEEIKSGGAIKKPFEKEYICSDGARLPVLISAAAIDEKRGNGVAIVLDISEKKKAENDLKAAMEGLERSNKELEQFAFVASHDLQEPLRAITGYIQLLEKKYSGKLDNDADSYIKTVVSGAGRMRNLINDLLAFSRIGYGEKKATVKVDMNSVFDAVKYGLGKAILESGAVVTKDDLPEVHADETQMVQLLQNLVSNAIKFRGTAAPVIHVSAAVKGKRTVFSVKDNGIGIEPQYFEKIFVIFQRLHSRDEYPGTGIGLSIAKKIVEKNGGAIWVESELGKGTTFYFTLKKEAKDGRHKQ
jgi:PAS domain S-box-containing protein